jgi:hypothetical protein
VFYKVEKIMSQYEAAVPIPDWEEEEHIMHVKCNNNYIVRYEITIIEVVKRKTTSMKV